VEIEKHGNGNRSRTRISIDVLDNLQTLRQGTGKRAHGYHAVRITEYQRSLVTDTRGYGYKDRLGELKMAETSELYDKIDSPPEKIDTKTFMLPDWVITARIKSIDDALLYAKTNDMDEPYMVIGYLQQALKSTRDAFTRAKPTKTETYY